MVDDANLEEVVPQEEGASKSKSKLLIVVASVVLVAVVCGILTYKLAIAPMFAEDQPEEDKEPKIPGSVVSVPFEQGIATVIMPDPDIPASQLLFRVTLDCRNLKTATLIEAHKPRFEAMIHELHEFRTRKELTDPLVKESIEKQALQKANEILRQLQEEPDPTIEVIDVFHVEFLVHDSL